MALRRWEPFRGITRLHEEMDRLFEDFLKPFWPERREVPAEGYRLPTLDLAETETEFLLKVELPGVDKKDLSVEVLPDSVVLKAEASEEKETKEASYHRRERSYRCFQRTIPLPAEVKSAEAKAAYKDGLLEVRLPKTEAAIAAKPVKVEIR